MYEKVDPCSTRSGQAPDLGRQTSPKTRNRAESSPSLRKYDLLTSGGKWGGVGGSPQLTMGPMTEQGSCFCVLLYPQ